MSLYPTLEDMQVDKMVQAQQNAFMQQQFQNTIQPPPYTSNPYPELNSMPETSGAMASSPSSSSLNKEMYPHLLEYMGLELSPAMIAANFDYLEQRNNGEVAHLSGSMISQPIVGGMVAPLSGASKGLQRAQVTHGIRELILCKGADGKVGLRVQAVNKGVFVCMVVKDTPAAMAGLRFGDQILQVNGQLVAGYSVDKLHKLIKKSSINNISVIIRDRPFERTITMHKDSAGNVGFQFRNQKITAIALDSSAARNGLLIDHHLLEINGQNVIGMKDKDISAIINGPENIITVTIIPSFIYEHIMKEMSFSFVKGKMDHSIPDI